MPITYLEAIRAAQHKLLADDPRVFIYGQDVGGFGGAFKATKRLAQEFPGRGRLAFEQFVRQDGPDHSGTGGHHGDHQSE